MKQFNFTFLNTLWRFFVECTKQERLCNYYKRGRGRNGWIRFGEVMLITDKAISEGTATPMIIVMSK